MIRPLLLVVLVVLASTIATTAQADPHGFTGAIAASTGLTRLTSNAITPDTTEVGAGYTLTLGGFLREDFAIAAHANVLFAINDDTLDGAGANVVLGAIAQYWPTSQLSVFGGPGFSVAAYNRNQPMSFEEALGLDSGFTPLVGASWFPLRARGWRASVEAAPLITGDGVVAVTAGVSLGWQYVQR